MGAYVNTGPFSNGSAPGISAGFLNSLESFIQQQQGNLNVVVLNGGISGTATCYQVVQGTFKYTFVLLNNFKTGGSPQQITLPTAYVYGASIRTTDTETMSVRSGGSDQPTSIMKAFPASAGAAGQIFTGAAVFNGWNFCDLHTGFNQVNFGASWSAAHGGFIVIEGS